MEVSNITSPPSFGGLGGLTPEDFNNQTFH
jgi:hypothetical protein